MVGGWAAGALSALTAVGGLGLWGRGGWWAAVPPVLFRPHPSPLPRGRGGRRRNRPHLGAVPRGRGGKRGWRLRRWLLFPPSARRGGGCAAVALPPSTPALSLAGEGGRGGGALGPALSLVGEGVRGGGGCAAGWSSALGPAWWRLRPGAVPRGRGGRRGWRLGRWCSSALGPAWWAAAPRLLFPPSPQPSPSRERGEEGVAAAPLVALSALTPALSLAGEGVRGGGCDMGAFSLAVESLYE